jgi:polyisoprenoid-binding protein YceI
VLSGLGEITAVGRTPELDGTLIFEEGFLLEAEVVADLTKLRSDRSLRDSRVQSALNTSIHPQAVFVLSEPLPTIDNRSIDSMAQGFLTVNGFTNPVEVNFQAQLVGEIVTVVGTFEVDLIDYGVQAPSAPIVVSVEDTAIVEFQLFFIED